MFRLPTRATATELTRQTTTGLFIHDSADDLPGLPQGPFARRPDGAIVAVEDRDCLTSTDDGASWTRTPMFPDTPADVVLPSREIAVCCTPNNVVVAACMNLAQRHWTWQDELHDAPGAVLPTCAMRSLDGGRTWQPYQELHPDWTGAIRTMIRLESGRILFTSMKMQHNPGRHSVMTYASDDEGASWRPSNVIDLGGAGHHGGVTEPTIVALNDGRLLMLIRTNWGMLWRAESVDGGAYWHPYGPTGIDASSAPAQLLRLASGQIMLAWNRLYPEGKTSYPLRGGDCLWSATPVSNFRGEVTVAFSSDECATWSTPVVVARDAEDKWLSYPHLFEVAPGLIWLTVMQGSLRLRLREAALCK